MPRPGLLLKLRSLVLDRPARALARATVQCIKKCGCNTPPPPRPCCIGADYIGHDCQPGIAGDPSSECCDCGKAYTITAHLEGTNDFDINVPIALANQDQLHDINASASYLLDATMRVTCQNGITTKVVTAMTGYRRTYDAITGTSIDEAITLDGQNVSSSSAREWLASLGCAPDIDDILVFVGLFQLQVPGRSGVVGCLPDPNPPSCNNPRVTYPAQPGCPEGSPDCVVPQVPGGTVGLERRDGFWAGSASCTHADYHWRMSGGVWANTAFGVQLPDGYHWPAAVSVGSLDTEITGSVNVRIDEPCDVSPCDSPPPEMGACCGIFPYLLGVVTCIQTTAFDCVGRVGSAWHANTSCRDAHCPPPGACCLPSGGCVTTTQTDCSLVRRGTWHADIKCPGPGEPCGIVGACCLPDQTCVVTGAFDCRTRGGQYIGDATTCEGRNCIPDTTPHGPCCIDSGGPDQECFENVTLAGCIQLAGFRSAYWEPGTTCATVAGVGCIAPPPGPGLLGLI